MISIHVKEMNGVWFGLACTGEDLVATAVSPARERTLGYLLSNLPSGVKCQPAEEESDFAAKTFVMLSRLDSGDERDKRYSLSAEYIPEPVAKILKAAAAIPIGYATSYGNVARASDTDARAVGRVMASNPLYPVVPCHRVVGADFSLVGYGGKKSLTALRAKLTRLSREVRGFTEAREVLAEGRRLKVYPVEWVIGKAERLFQNVPRQPALFRRT